MKEFNVPVTSNSVSAGGFELKVNIKKVSVKTKATSLEFECSYKGQGIAVVDPSKIQLKVVDTDIQFGNDNSKMDVIEMNKGDKTTIKTSFHIPAKVADMQFAKMLVVWNGVFVERLPEEIDGQNIKFELDKELTAKQN